jgi:RNA polymerase sigma-70 factor (ECF subfamily)
MTPPCTSSVPTPRADATRWFAEEVLPHERSLRRWLCARFPWLTDIDDLVQESYARLFRAKEAGQIAHAKSYLFATARNAAFDLARRHHVVAIDAIADLSSLSVLEDTPDAGATLSHEQELELLARAIHALPRRCRLALKLRKLQGLSHREIAERLGISEHTVNAHLARGTALCRDFLRRHGVD